jgi:hypothetical protein
MKKPFIERNSLFHGSSNVGGAIPHNDLEPILYLIPAAVIIVGAVCIRIGKWRASL